MQKKFLAASLLLVGSLGYLVSSSLTASTMKAVPVKELRAADAKPTSFVGQKLRAVGFVGTAKPKNTLAQTEAGAVKTVHFEIVEGDAKLMVSYANTLPDTFRAGGPVQVDGTYVEAGKIKADHVLTKCPSKYEEEQAAKQKEKEGYKNKGGAQKSGAQSAKNDVLASGEQSG